MKIQRGQTALITGASSGLGKEFATQLAERGLNPVLLARSERAMNQLAEELMQRFGVRVEVIPADLGQSGATQAIYAQLEQRALLPDLLINNAGFATYGVFDQVDLTKQLSEIQVNVMAVVELTHLFLPTLLKRQGGIINVASRGGFQPAGNMAIYGATKAFVISFSEALWAENRSRGVQVSVVCPGPVATAFFDELGAAAAIGGAMASPTFVVTAALKGFERGSMNIIPGWPIYLSSQLPRLLPRAAMARVAEWMTRSKRDSSNVSTPRNVSR